MIVFLCLLALASAKPQGLEEGQSLHSADPYLCNAQESTDGGEESLKTSNDFVPQQDINPELEKQPYSTIDHLIKPRSCFPMSPCDATTNLRQAQCLSQSPFNMLQHFQTVHQHVNPIQQQCLHQHQIEILQKQYQNEQLLLQKQYQGAIQQALCQPLPGVPPTTNIHTEYIPPPKMLSSTQWSTPAPNIDIANLGLMDHVDRSFETIRDPMGGCVNTEFIPGSSFNLGACQVTPLYAITCVGSA